MKRILAIDYGDVRVGLAISDLTQTIAQPFETLLYNNSNHLLNQLDNIIRENNIGLIVVGIPYNMKGEDTQQTRYSPSTGRNSQMSAISVKMASVFRI